MRMRTLKPGFFTNEDLAALPPLCRILFAGLWGFADREGRFEWRPKRIKVEVLPFDECDVEAMLEQLRAAGFVVKFLRGQNTFGYIPTFLEHQRPHKNEQNSVIPAAPVRKSGTTKARCATDQGSSDDDQRLTKDAQSLGAGKQSLGNKTVQPPDGPVVGSAADVSSKSSGKEKKPPDPQAVELCAWFGDCIAHWKPDAKIDCESKSSLDEMRRLVAVDGRDPVLVRALLGWLFGGTPTDYQPTQPNFDWRPNVASGGKLRQQWDKLETLYAAQRAQEGIGRDNGHREQSDRGWAPRKAHGSPQGTVGPHHGRGTHVADG